MKMQIETGLRELDEAQLKETEVWQQYLQQKAIGQTIHEAKSCIAKLEKTFREQQRLFEQLKEELLEIKHKCKDTVRSTRATERLMNTKYREECF